MLGTTSNFPSRPIDLNILNSKLHWLKVHIILFYKRDQQTCFYSFVPRIQKLKDEQQKSRKQRSESRNKSDKSCSRQNIQETESTGTV